MVKKKPLPENVFSIKYRYVHYLSFATLASHVAFVGAVLFEFLCRHIFGGFYNIFQLWVSSMDGCPKIRHKYLCTVTLIAQPLKRIHSLPMWHMKDNGHIYTFFFNIFSANWGSSWTLGYVIFIECWHSERAQKKWLIIEESMYLTDILRSLKTDLLYYLGHNIFS